MTTIIRPIRQGSAMGERKVVYPHWGRMVHPDSDQQMLDCGRVGAPLTPMADKLVEVEEAIREVLADSAWVRDHFLCQHLGHALESIKYAQSSVAMQLAAGANPDEDTE